VRDSLGRIRARGEPVDLTDLARRLLQLAEPPPLAVARRLVGGALGCDPDGLPARVDPALLRAPEEAAVAGRALATATFAVVDLETTGFAAAGASILEIGAVRVTGLEPRDGFASLVRPPGPVPSRIVALTGIDDARVADAPRAPVVLRRFRRWLERTDPVAFVAHNASFDAAFVERGFSDCGIPAFRAPVLCTRKLARRVWPELGRYSLDHLCAHLGIANAARHRASGDAAATARAWVELLVDARETLGVETVGDLLDLQERPPPRRARR
jgi:DNA polymerase-3 subunit epsilon